MSNAIVPVEDYGIMLMDQSAMIEVIAENLGGEQDIKFPRIKVPAGGGLAWEIPTTSGPVAASSLEGVIVAQKTVRGYWDTPFSGAKNLPKCRSADGIVGVGDPTGIGGVRGGLSCVNCPQNQWGSGNKGNAKACNERRLLYIVFPKGLLPYEVNVPPSSIGAVKDYLTALAIEGVPYFLAQTRIKLEKAISGEGIAYSHLVIEKIGSLLPDGIGGADAETRANADKMRAYHQQIKESIGKLAVDMGSTFADAPGCGRDDGLVRTSPDDF